MYNVQLHRYTEHVEINDDHNITQQVVIRYRSVTHLVSVSSCICVHSLLPGLLQLHVVDIGLSPVESHDNVKLSPTSA